MLQLYQDTMTSKDLMDWYFLFTVTYWITSMNLILVTAMKYLKTEVLLFQVNIIQASNGSHILVYCDMEGSNCDGKGGWMRVGYLNMSEPYAICPHYLTQRQYNNIDHDVCGRPNSGMSAHTFSSTKRINYNKVCGQLRGYQYQSPDGFGHGNNNIDSCYVDDISITYGSSPRKHIWTYVNGFTSDNVPHPESSCPCSTNNIVAPGRKPNLK